MLRRVVIRFLRDEDGATAIEYGVLAACLAIGIIVAATTLGDSIAGLFGYVETEAGGVLKAAAGN